MTFRLNDALRNTLADILGTTFDSGVLEIRSGAQPTTADTAATGVLLASIDLPADAFAAAAAGVAVKAGVWSATIIANGTAAWARFRNPADTVRMDVTIGSELLLDGVALLIDDTVTVATFTLMQPTQ